MSSANDVTSDAKFRFKQGFGTIDAIFALHGMIPHHINNGNKLFCCFVDYKKPFDSIAPYKMFYKLARSGVTGKLLSVIRTS